MKPLSNEAATSLSPKKKRERYFRAGSPRSREILLRPQRGAHCGGADEDRDLGGGVVEADAPPVVALLHAHIVVGVDVVLDVQPVPGQRSQKLSFGEFRDDF